MKVDLSKVSYDGEEVQFGDATLTIRPLPASLVVIAWKDGCIMLTGDEGLKTFDYCLTMQRGILDAEDKPLRLTKDVKKMIYDFKTDPTICPIVDGVSLVDFVLQHVRKKAERIVSETKN
jgi:hypothetical protein